MYLGGCKVRTTLNFKGATLIPSLETTKLRILLDSMVKMNLWGFERML
jgi:hypothetical protein